MGVKDVVKVSRKTFFNPRAWLGYDLLKDQTLTIWALVKGVVTLPRPEKRPEKVETFEQAMQRLGVNEQDVKKAARTYFLYALFFLGLAIIDVVYGFYLLFHHHAFLGLVLALAVCALLLSQAFRYHFWYFQIKNRKLGCTWEEWRQGRIAESQHE